MFSKVKEAGKECSSYRRRGNRSGSQKARKNYGRLLNAKWAFSSKDAEQVESSPKAVKTKYIWGGQRV